MSSNTPDPLRVQVFPCVLSYPSLFEKKAWKNDDGDDKSYYSVELWFYTTDPRYAENYQTLYAAKMAAIAQKWGANPPHKMYDPLRGLNEKQNPPEEQGFFVRCKTPTRPAVRKKDPNSPPGQTQYIDVTDPEDVYPGIIAAVSLTASPFDTPKQKGVSFWLNQVVLLRDGVRLGGESNRSAEEEFGGALTQHFGQLTTGDAQAASSMAPGMPPGMMPPQYPPQYPPQMQPQFAPQAPPMPPGMHTPMGQAPGTFAPIQGVPQYAPQPGYPLQMPMQSMPPMPGMIPGMPGVPLPY